MSKISAVVCTYNEENNIEDCLKTLSFCDEIILVDTHSTDNTVKIAKKYTKNIFQKENEGYVEPIRQFAIDKANNEWIMLLDADERISKDLSTKLKEIKEADSYDAVWVPRKNFIFNKWVKGIWPDYQMRFFKKSNVKYGNKIHAKPIINGREYKIETNEKLALIHYNYASISQFLRKLDKYTTQESKELLNNKYEFEYMDLIKKPTNDFINWFIVRKCYLDGIHGLSFCLLMSFYQLVTLLKVWEARGFIKVNSLTFKDDVKTTIELSHKDLLYWFNHKDSTKGVGIIHKVFQKVLKKT